MKSGVPYFAPIPDSVTNPKPSAEQHRELWAARDLASAARKLGGFGSEHSPEDYASAAKLYEDAANAFEKLGLRGFEVSTCRHQAQRCREKSERGR